MRPGFASLAGALYVGAMALGANGAEEAGTKAEAEGERAPNRLVESKSPYLLQHAYNPVDWYPWGEEAFAKAREENKPILLSIGYSTCHWCHVMERESFESEAVAEFLNEHFVAIKLDREERPDVDRVYMTAFQAMMGQGGGWPLNMFLTPDLKPFFGGTYFPPEDRGGRPGFLSVLKQLDRVWNERRDELLGSADEIHKRLSEVIAESQKLTAGREAVSAELLERAVPKFMAGADLENGGWGQGQKFPQPSHLRFLLRHGDEKGREFALMTCRKMIGGGIHDQIGGGFHRYTVDPAWLVPHFEKMLYDQAQILEVMLEAWLLTGALEFREAAVGIVEYVLKELTHEEGGFFSAQDAQSEGKEGKYWCWTQAELKELLEEDEFLAVKERFGITENGNFVDHSDPEPLPNQNVLAVVADTADWPETRKKALAAGIAKMRAAREKRVPPATDDKVLASWNGLMIAALARAGRHLKEERYLEAAHRAHRFVVDKLWDDANKTLSHRWRDDHVDGSQQAESYLYFLRGTRVLYEATLDADDLALAVGLAQKAGELFYDRENGGFFDGEKREDLVIRLKDDFDSATPTPTSVGILEFAILDEITGREDFREVAALSLRAAVPTLEEAPTSRAESLLALDFFVAKPARLVIAGGENQEAFLEGAWGGVRRNLLIMGNDGPVDEFTAGLEPIDGKTTAYYCVGQTCRLPETDPSKVAAWLKEDPGAGESPGE